METDDRTRGRPRQDDQVLQGRGAKMMWKSAVILAALLWPACAPSALSVEIGDTGLRHVMNDGVELLSPGYARDIRPTNATPRIVRSDGPPFVPDDAPVISTRGPGRVVRTYPWGVVDCEYSTRGDRIVFSLAIANTSQRDTIAALELHLTEFTFSTMPQGRSPDAGMFGTGGRWRLFGPPPLVAEPPQKPPLLFVRHQQGRLAVAAH